jgi:hypothetical protein
MIACQPSRMTTFYVRGLILASLIMGGGTSQGLWTDHLLYVLFVPLIGIAIARVDQWKLSRLSSVALAGATLMVVWQLAPVANPSAVLWLPSGIDRPPHVFWAPDIGRALEPALFFVTLAAFAVFVSTLDERGQTALVPYFLVGAAINLAVGLVQRSYDAVSVELILLPFAGSFGFFANENHGSVLAYCSIVLCGFYFLSINNNPYLYGMLSFATLIVLFSFESRAAFVFASFLSVVTWSVFKRSRPNSVTIYVAPAFFAVISTSLLLVNINSISDNYRSEFYHNLFEMTINSFPFGIGAGSFVHIYPALNSQTETIQGIFINAAHNDWLQIFAENGIFSLVVFSINLLIFKRKYNRKLEIALLIIVVFISLHSLIDYPLRSFGISLIFAFAMGIMASVLPVPKNIKAQNGSDMPD